MFNKKYWLWLFVLPICAVGCKKDNGTDIDPEVYRPLYDVALAYDELEQGMNTYSQQGYSATAALVAAAQDLESLPSVSNTWFVDSSYIHLVMSSGLEAVYVLTPVDSVGAPIYRGGGSAGGGAFKMFSATCSNEITNKKILLFNAAFGTSYDAGQTLVRNRDKYNLEIDELLGSECTYNVVTTFGNYGLVVINTHGLPNGFLLGEKLPAVVKNDLANLEAFAEKFNNDAARSIADRILADKQLGIAFNKKYDPKVPIHEQTYEDADTFAAYIPAKKLAQFNFSNTIIVGNMCYSGFDNTSYLEASNIPILEAFRQANTKTYFGYQQTAGLSMPVNSNFAERMELRLYEGFFNKGDSTGSVHLSGIGVESSDPLWYGSSHPQIQNFGDLYFRQFFANDRCYEDPCGILEDTRDGTKYKTVCIGNQRWMAENLKYDAPGSLCFDNDAGNCNTYGRLYSYETAVGSLTQSSNSIPSGIQGICPDGWHIPSSAEWGVLVDSVGGKAIAGRVLKSATNDWWFNGEGTDDFGFAVLPTGQGFESASTPLEFVENGRLAIFLSTNYDSQDNTFLGARFEVSKDDFVYSSVWSLPGNGGKAYSPCRCVED